MHSRRLTSLRALVALAILAALSGSPHTARADLADEHAPIGVMADHTHDPGEIMLSYRFMTMSMDGHRDGTRNLSIEEVLEQFPVAPTEMTMDMHMFGAMYGVTDWLTAMVMVPWIDLEMDHRTRSGGQFTTRSNGVGDVTLGGLFGLYESGDHAVIARAALTLPSGSINQRDNTPMGDQRLPYPMQLGSGTYDLAPALTYTGGHGREGWGAQVRGTVRLGENGNDYTLGDRFAGTGWYSHRWMDWLSTSLRIAGEVWGNVDGADPTLNAAVVPTADPSRRGGERIDLGFGVNLIGVGGVVDEHRLAIEVDLPVYQRLDGPQLENDWAVTVGWQRAIALFD